jgi:hypothetical protein
LEVNGKVVAEGRVTAKELEHGLEGVLEEFS